MTIEKELGKNLLVLGKTEGFSLGITANKFYIWVDLIKVYISLEFGVKKTNGH